MPKQKPARSNQKVSNLRVLRLTWVRPGVVTCLSVDDCSLVHIWVESFRTAGLEGEGLEVDVWTVDVVVEATVVVKVGLRVTKRVEGLFCVTWLPDAPPPLGGTFGGVPVRVLLRTTVVTVGLAELTPPIVVVVVVVSDPLGKVLGLDRKMGSWPIPLASTKSVGT